MTGFFLGAYPTRLFQTERAVIDWLDDRPWFLYFFVFWNLIIRVFISRASGVVHLSTILERLVGEISTTLGCCQSSNKFNENRVIDGSFLPCFFFFCPFKQVKVTIKEPGSLEEKEIRTLGRGDFFGEKALQEFVLDFDSTIWLMFNEHLWTQGGYEDGQRDRQRSGRCLLLGHWSRGLQTAHQRHWGDPHQICRRKHCTAQVRSLILFFFRRKIIWKKSATGSTTVLPTSNSTNCASSRHWELAASVVWNWCRSATIRAGPTPWSRWKRVKLWRRGSSSTSCRRRRSWKRPTATLSSNSSVHSKTRNTFTCWWNVASAANCGPFWGTALSTDFWLDN